MKADFSDIKCIAFDLDGTVVNTEAGISKRTLAALVSAQRNGIALLPVSGRPFSSFPDWLLKMDEISLAVSSNGAAIYDLHAKERVHQWLLSANAVRAVMKSVGSFFLEGQITYEAFVDGIAYAADDYVAHPDRYGISANALSYIRQTRHPVRFIIDFVFENAACLDSLDLILKDPGLYRMVENTVRRGTEEIYITSSVPCRMEISSPNAEKASGMRWALDRLQAAPEETIAFGDGDNDASMLAAAGIGVAMKNAAESCMRNADFVTEYTADEDGVARFLEEHLLP